MDELLIYMLTSQRMWDIQSVLSESLFFFLFVLLWSLIIHFTKSSYLHH